VTEIYDIVFQKPIVDAHLEIEMGNNIYFKIISEPLYYPYLREFFGHLAVCGYVEPIKNTDGVTDTFKLDWKVESYLRYRPNGVYIKPFWHKIFCEKGGVPKSAFAKMQFLFYELKEFSEFGIFKFSICTPRGQVFPIWVKMRPRGGMSTKKLIKGFKKRHAYNDKDRISALNKCEYVHKKRAEGFITACCVCTDKELKILNYGNKTQRNKS